MRSNLVLYGLTAFIGLVLGFFLGQLTADWFGIVYYEQPGHLFLYSITSALLLPAILKVWRLLKADRSI